MGGEFEDSPRRTRRVGRELRAALMDLDGMLLPTECVGYGTWGEMVCDRCLAQVLGEPQALDLELAGIPDFAVANYEGAVRRFALTGKHNPRLGLRSYFAAADENMAALVTRLRVMECHREVFVVPTPSTTPGASSPAAGALVTGIMSGLIKSGVASQSGVLEVLKIRPGTKGQAGLGHSQRMTNRHHQTTLVAPEAGSEFSGVAAVLVNDVSTTGSTLQGMAWVLQGVGTETLGGFVFAISQFSQ